MNVFTRFRSSIQAFEQQETSSTIMGQVMPIFGGMLLLTGLVVWGMIETATTFVILSYGWVGLLGLLAVQILLIVGARVFREAYPLNIVFAALFAVLEGVFLAPLIHGYLTAGLGTLILEALAITAIIFVGFAAVPLLTGRDFSFLGAFLMPLLFGIIGIAALRMFVFDLSSTMIIAVDIGTVIVFSLFILYDVSKIQKEDYGPVGGAISLYLDFILIFIHVLELLGEAN